VPLRPDVSLLIEQLPHSTTQEPIPQDGFCVSPVKITDRLSGQTGHLAAHFNYPEQATASLPGARTMFFSQPLSFLIQPSDTTAL
jgi:hypothetical protein